MLIGIVEFELLIPGNNSLKGKRAVIKSLLSRLRNNFNVSAAEVDDQDRRQRAVVAVVHVANDRRRTNQVLSSVASFVERFRPLQILDYHMHII